MKILLEYENVLLMNQYLIYSMIVIDLYQFVQRHHRHRQQHLQNWLHSKWWFVGFL
jgi:hypothetical protein